jgi:twitching motility protein PilT
MHVGEKPYVVTATGHAELAAKPLTIPAMTGMLDQLLPADSRQALDELGAVEYHLPPQPESAPDARYSVVAARGGDDIWIEVRRRKVEPEAQAEAVAQAEEASTAPAAITVAAAEPELYTLETSGPIAMDEPVASPVVESEPEPIIQAVVPQPEPEAVVEPEEQVFVVEPEPVAVEAEPVAVEAEPVATDEPHVVVVDEPEIARVDDTPVGEAPTFTLEEPHAIAAHPPVVVADEPHVVTTDEPDFFAADERHMLTAGEPHVITSGEPHVITSGEQEPAAEEAPESITFEPTVVASEHADVPALDEPAPVHLAEPAASVEAPAPVEAEPIVAEAPVAAVEAVETVETIAEPVRHMQSIEPAEDSEEQPEAEPEPKPVVPHYLAPVVPMAGRAGMRFEPVPAASSQPRGEGLPHLLQVAASHGASVLYVAVRSKPSLRVDGEIRVLEHETPLTEALLEEGLKAILSKSAGPAAGEIETCDVPGVGRVQCLSFRDHRGLGAMFKMLPARAISAEQMGLGAPIHALCTETEGLVLVSGARGAGKSTLVAALVDQMNRTRRDHVITVEQQIQFVHENRQSFVSQREARDDEAFAEAVKSALREGPDVLVVDQVASAEAAEFALHAAAGGHLVIASITAATTAAALARFIEFFGEERAQARLTLSEHLRGVITQSLLRKSGGGRAAAREVLVNVPSVASLIADGQIEQLASVLNGGRRVGMVPLNDALLALVQSGALDVREAYRKSPDQQELVTQLNRAGLDTTFAERLA